MVGSNSTNREGENYIKYINNQFIQHNIYDKEKVLGIRSKFENTGDSVMTDLNKLDKLITSIMIRSEKLNCKKKDNNTLWTPQIIQSNLRIQYWNIKLKSAKQGIESTERMNQIMSKMDGNCINILQQNKRSLTKALEKALLDHANLCRANATDRHEYLTEKMEDLKERNLSGHVTFKQLIQREQCRNDFRIIRIVLNPRRSKGIKHLDVYRTGSS